MSFNVRGITEVQMALKIEISTVRNMSMMEPVHRNYCHRDSDDDLFASDGEADLEEDEEAIEEDEYTISSS